MEVLGTLAGVLSSAVGGSSIVATRYLVDAADPLLIGVFRFGIGAVVIVPLAYLTGGRWPASRDYPIIALLGLLFFGAFPILFNASLAYTTAARGALALSTLPLLTMGLAALLRVEPLSIRKAVGVTVAVGGVAISLGLDSSAAPAGAWRGDALMTAAALCMAFYTVMSKAVIQRSDPLTFTSVGMIVGSFALAACAIFYGSFGAVVLLTRPQWWALTFLGFFGGALTFYLWALALRFATPTRVAISVTVNPIVAAIFATAFLDEPLRPDLLIGMAAVAGGIGIAVTGSRSRSQGGRTMPMGHDAMMVFATEWIANWNKRDIDAVLQHFAEEAEFVSPVAVDVVGTAVVVGKVNMAAYWRAALNQIPSLQFKLDHATWDGPHRILTVVYLADLAGRRRRACEIMTFDAAGRQTRGEAFYGAEL